MVNYNLDEAMNKWLTVEIALTMLIVRHIVPGEGANCWTKMFQKYMMN